MGNARGHLHRRANVQDLVIAEDLLGGGLVPFTVGNLAVGDRDVEGVVDQVILEDSIVGGAGGERWRRVDLREERERTLHSHHRLLGDGRIEAATAQRSAGEAVASCCEHLSPAGSAWGSVSLAVG